jgi:hypothetical protein
MVEVNEYIVSDEIDKYGSTVVIKHTQNTYSDYGDILEGTATLSTTVAVVNILTSEAIEVREGTYHPGDKRFFLKPSETIEAGYVIIHDSNTYEVVDCQKHELNDTKYAIEATCKKVTA